MRLSAETFQLFPGETRGFNYAGWRRIGRLLTSSQNAPAGLVWLQDREPSRNYYRTRQVYRKMHHVTARGDTILVGVSTAGTQASQQKLELWLVGAGGLVLTLGLGGCWILIGRSLRPITEISAAAIGCYS